MNDPATLPCVLFSLEAIRDSAVEKSGYDDFGSDSYMAGLEPLLYSIEHEARLNHRGQIEMRRRIVDGLANRLTVVAWEKANPALASAAIVAPLIIVGLPRTGSSILHETLSAAPDTRTPLIWEVRDFALAHAIPSADADERMRQINAAIAEKNKIVPGYAAMHYENAQIPMECAALTILDMHSVLFWSIAWMPTYCKFLLSHDAHSAYDWHRRALRYFQATRPARWVLKAPMHSAYLDVLLDTYPDAMIVQTHRDPAAVIGSMCSLHATLRRPWSDHVAVKEFAAFDAGFTADIIHRAVAFRHDNPKSDAHIYDVAFKNFMADPEGTLRRIYAHFGLELTETVREAMTGYFANRPREKHGKHSYSLEQFDFTEAGVAAIFSEYVSQYGRYF